MAEHPHDPVHYARDAFVQKMRRRPEPDLRGSYYWRIIPNLSGAGVSENEICHIKGDDSSTHMDVQPPFLDTQSRATVESFADFEHGHLLHYIYLGDIRGAAIFTTLGGALAFYFTRPTIAASSETLLFDILTIAWLSFAAIGFALAGIAVCPIPFRWRLPRGRSLSTRSKQTAQREEAVITHTSVTHYLDVAAYANSDEYIAQLSRIQDCQITSRDGLLREKLRECYASATSLQPFCVAK